eukprot:1145438-Pelagomonas_calceolata.AAC.1
MPSIGGSQWCAPSSTHPRERNSKCLTCHQWCAPTNRASDMLCYANCDLCEADVQDEQHALFHCTHLQVVSLRRKCAPLFPQAGSRTFLLQLSCPLRQAPLLLSIKQPISNIDHPKDPVMKHQWH